MSHSRTPSTALAAALAAAFLLAACDRNDTRSAGQQVDEAIAEGKQAAGKARESARTATGGAIAAASDATITTKVNAALAADDRLKATRIDVDTQQGRVTLEGKAPDAASRDRATVLAQAVEGVIAVENRLTVSGG